MRIPAELIEIPGGEFNMGQENGATDERPVHRVVVARFALSRYQVANADYDAFVHATGRAPADNRSRTGFALPEQPVVAVNWFDAVAFCNWLGRQTGRHFRLPTEAEWEYAARGGLENCEYPWGNRLPAEREDYANRWLHGPEPVGTSAPNRFGLFDVCENVREWCADWYDAGWYPVSPAYNPKGPARGSVRVARGGSWRLHVKIARCAARASLAPAFRYADFGFRVACDLP